MRKFLTYKLFEIKTETNKMYDLLSLISSDTSTVDFNEIKKYLNDGIDINFIPKYGSPALVKSVIHNNLTLVKLFLEYGADVNIASIKLRNTPLIVSSMNFDENKTIEIVDCLINHNVDLCQINKDGYDFISICDPNKHTNLFEIPYYLLQYKYQHLFLSKEPSLYKSFIEAKIPLDPKIEKEFIHLKTGSELNLF